MNVVDALDDETMLENKLVLRPLIGLLHGMTVRDVELFVVNEIAKHRRLRDEAVKLQREIGRERRIQGLECEDRAYVTAMIAVHAQQTVVSTLLDILGYIPELQSIKPH